MRLALLPNVLLKQTSAFLNGREVAALLQTIKPLKAKPWLVYEGRSDLVVQLVVNRVLQKRAFTLQEESVLLHTAPTIHKVNVANKWCFDPEQGTIVVSQRLVEFVVATFRKMSTLHISCIPGSIGSLDPVHVTHLDVETTSLAAIKQKMALRVLRVRECALQECMEAFDYFPELEVFEFNSPETGDESQLSKEMVRLMAEKLPHLTSFTFRGDLESDAIEAFIHMRRLKSLALKTSDGTCTAAMLQEVQKLSTLESFAFNIDVDAAHEVYKEVSSLPLTSLDLHLVADLPMAQVTNFFSNLTRLHTLNFLGPQSAPIEALKACVRLEVLTIVFSLANRDMSFLSALQNMRVLEFHEEVLSNSLLQALSLLPKLEKLVLRRLNGTVDWIAAPNLPQLRCLECHYPFGDKALDALMHLIQKTAVTELRIRGFRFDASYVPAILEKSTLKSLWVDMPEGTPLHPAKPIEEGLMCFAKMTHLEELHISQATRTEATQAVIEQLKAALPTTIVTVR